MCDRYRNVRGWKKYSAEDAGRYGVFLCGQSSGTADSEDGRTVKRAGDGDQQGCSWSRYPEWTEFL